MGEKVGLGLGVGDCISAACKSGQLRGYFDTNGFLIGICNGMVHSGSLSLLFAI